MRKPNKEPDKVPEVFLPDDDFRADLIPGSQALPDRSLFRERLAIFTPSRVISLVAVVVLLTFGWFLFAGPGKPAMEKFLTKLSDQVSVPAYPPAASPTAVGLTEPESTNKTPIAVVPTKTPITQPTRTEAVSRTSTPSPTPSLSPTITLTALPTVTPTLTPLPTTESIGCIPAASVTTGDVGRILCVTGNVLRIQSAPSFFLIILENPKDAFYFVSYDRKWDNLKVNDCVFATGEIAQLGNNPIMILNYKVPIEYCR
jgi:hypothetical protein